MELAGCMREGLIDYDTKERSKWVDDHPGQVVATVAQMTWARGTEKVTAAVCVWSANISLVCTGSVDDC